MKTIKYISFVFLFVASITTDAFAQITTQQSFDDNIAVSATVESSVIVTGTSALEFGDVSDNFDHTIAVTSANVGTGVGTLGRFTIQDVTQGQSVTFGLDGTETLALNGNNDDNSTGTIEPLPATYEATLTIDDDLDTAPDNTAFTFNDVDGTASINVASTTSIDYFVYVGGTLPLLTDAGIYSGAYLGSMTLTVSYD